MRDDFHVGGIENQLSNNLGRVVRINPHVKAIVACDALHFNEARQCIRQMPIGPSQGWDHQSDMQKPLHRREDQLSEACRLV